MLFTSTTRVLFIGGIINVHKFYSKKIQSLRTNTLNNYVIRFWHTTMLCALISKFVGALHELCERRKLTNIILLINILLNQKSLVQFNWSSFPNILGVQIIMSVSLAINQWIHHQLIIAVTLSRSKSRILRFKHGTAKFIHSISSFHMDKWNGLNGILLSPKFWH